MRLFYLQLFAKSRTKNFLSLYFGLSWAASQREGARLTQHANHFPLANHFPAKESSYMLQNLHVSTPQFTVVALMSDTLTRPVQQKHLHCCTHNISTFCMILFKRNRHIYCRNLMIGLHDILSQFQSGFSQHAAKSWDIKMTRKIQKSNKAWSKKHHRKGFTEKQLQAYHTIYTQ